MFHRRNHEQPATPEPQPKPEPTLQFDAIDDFDDLSGEASASATTAYSSSPAEGQQASMAGSQADTMTASTDLPESTPFGVTQSDASDGAPRPRPAESVIGPDDFFDGNYRSERGVRIQGTARGSIESRQYIHVEEGAQVEANLAAEDITISGRFNGTIECRGRLEIAGSGMVQGNVQTARLVVHDGGVLDGELHMQRPDANTEAQSQHVT